MSTTRRAYDLLRGYVNREYDRIKGVDFDSAQRELDQAIEGGAPRGGKPGPFNSSSDGSQGQSSDSQEPMSREERASRILGVEVNCSFEQVRKAFERLNKRSEPSNFPVDSRERDQAAQIQKHVQWAYGVLTDEVDTVEKRFRSLEID